MQVIWETQLAKPISQIQRIKVPSLLCGSMTALWQSIAGSGSVSLKWLNQEVLPHTVRPDVHHWELFFMPNSSTKIKHSHTHIHTQREADCQPVSMSVLAGENAVCVFDGWKYHTERERERDRAYICKCLTHQCWQNKSCDDREDGAALGILQFSQYFLAPTRQFGPVIKYRDLLPTNYRAILRVHAG